MRLLLGRRIWGPHVPCRTVSPCFQKSVVCGPPRGHPVRAARVDRNQSTVSEIDLYKVVETPRKPDAPLSSQSGMPWYISIPAGFVALIATLRVVKAFRKRRDSDALAERGFKRAGAANEDHYTRLMKGMKTVQYEELSPEQIEAARRRRRQEIAREGGSLDLDAIELPENHPFAVKKNVSKEEEELQRLRLSARRGLSPEDMRLLKQQQEMASKMDEEEEEARNRRGPS